VKTRAGIAALFVLIMVAAAWTLLGWLGLIALVPGVALVPLLARSDVALFVGGIAIAGVTVLGTLVALLLCSFWCD
jgi:hypothetical protein